MESSGILTREGNGYTFCHASFREYLASQLLVNKIRAGETISVFVADTAWEPVLVFAAQLFDDTSEARSFLLEVLDVDLYLYIRCLANTVSCLKDASTLPSSATAHVLLREMLEVRTRIIAGWFPSLSALFPPYAPRGTALKPAIVGGLHGQQISYGYTTEDKVGKPVCLLEELPAGTTLGSLMKSGILTSGAVIALPASGIGVLAAHSLAIEDIWRDLQHIVEKKQMAEPLALVYEQTQEDVEHLKKGNAFPLSTPFDVSSVEAVVARLLAQSKAKEVFLGFGSSAISLNDLVLRLRRLRESSCSSLESPLLPRPDRWGVGSYWVTHLYTDEALVDYVMQYFRYFLQSYRELVELNLPRLSHRLRLYQLLPVRVVASIRRPPPTRDFESIGSCDYYFEPLENGAENEVIVSLNRGLPESEIVFRESRRVMDAWIETLKTNGRWNSAVSVWTCQSLLSAFFGEHNQLRHDVYGKLLDDLRKVFD